MSMFVFIVSNALPKTGSACEYNTRHFKDGYVVKWYFFWLTGALDLKEVEKQTTIVGMEAAPKYGITVSFCQPAEVDKGFA